MSDFCQFWRDPLMPFVESRRACHSRACYRPHSHPALSIGTVDRGDSILVGQDGGRAVLRAGTLVTIPAGRVHSCNPRPGAAWSYQMLYLDPSWLDQPPSDSDPIRIFDHPGLYRDFTRLNALLFSAAAPAEKQQALRAFVAACHSRPGHCLPLSPRPAGRDHQVGQAMRAMRAAPDSNAPVAELAHQVGLSPFQLIRAFHAATGLTPHAWRLNQRVTLARDLLRRGAPLAEIAHQLGFADQAHFHRVFKAHAGVTPGDFRRHRTG